LTETTFTVDGITEGVVYKFKVTATNILGEGQASEEFAVFVSDMPEIMQPVATSIIGTKVIVAWEAPDDNHDPITSYEILFVSNSGELVQLLPECGGSDPTLT